jgi:hypothetical protein
MFLTFTDVAHLVQTFKNVKRSALEVGPKVNERKTGHTEVTRRQQARSF